MPRFTDLSSRLNIFSRNTTPKEGEAGQEESNAPPKQSLAKRIQDASRRALVGNRRESEQMRIRGGMTPQEARQIEDARRRDAALAALSSSGDALIDGGEDLPGGVQTTDRSQRLIDRMIQRSRARSERKRWGGGGRVEHKYGTTDFKISPRKLQLLADQINGKPIDHAILQMQFSHKRAAKKIKSMLVLARDHAIATKGMDRERILVSEAWVGKGEKKSGRIEWKGRMHHGVIKHQWSQMDVVLRMGKTKEEEQQEKLRKWNRKVGRLSHKTVETHAPVGWGY